MNTEVIVEYAQCFDCYEELNASYSQQTMSDIWDRWYNGHIGHPQSWKRGYTPGNTVLVEAG
ncbi:MAG TPA: hypothetical protein DCS60_04775 [Opitutae bacterium]|nr:hypothetical protein [Opitutae bacterium]